MAAKKVIIKAMMFKDEKQSFYDKLVAVFKVKKIKKKFKTKLIKLKIATLKTDKSSKLL